MPVTVLVVASTTVIEGSINVWRKPPQFAPASTTYTRFPSPLTRMLCTHLGDRGKAIVVSTVIRSASMTTSDEDR